jgi:hypothetical protein
MIPSKDWGTPVFISGCKEDFGSIIIVIAIFFIIYNFSIARRLKSLHDTNILTIGGGKR